LRLLIFITLVDDLGTLVVFREVMEVIEQKPPG